MKKGSVADHGLGTLFWKVSLALDLFGIGAGHGCGIPALDGDFGVTWGSPCSIWFAANARPMSRTLAEDGAPAGGSRPFSEPVSSVMEQSPQPCPTLLLGPCWRPGDPRSSQGRGGPSHALLPVWEGL